VASAHCGVCICRPWPIPCQKMAIASREIAQNEDLEVPRASMGSTSSSHEAAPVVVDSAEAQPVVVDSADAQAHKPVVVDSADAQPHEPPTHNRMSL